MVTLMMVTAGVFSQVGIGTNTPNPGSILDLTATNKGLLLPRVAATSAIPVPVNGLIAYDISANCVRSYENNIWSGCLSSQATSTVIVNCNANGFEGSYSSSVALTAANVYTVTVTNKSFTSATVSFATGDLALSGITGITVDSVSPATATLNADQSVVITYTLTGTPATSGTLTGTWTKLPLNCVKTVPVL